MKKFLLPQLLTLSLLLAACAPNLTNTPIPTSAPLSPAQHLESALQWIQTHAVMAKNVDWVATRKEIAELVPNPKTDADTYPGICLALRRLRDANAWFLAPDVVSSNLYTGYNALYPEYQAVYSVIPDGPAEKAGLHVGDVIQTVNGDAPKPNNPDNLPPPCNTEALDTSTQEHLSVLRDGQLLQFTIDKVSWDFNSYPQPTGKRLGTDASGIGYIELSPNGGETYYPGNVQLLMKKIDTSPVCGWIIDLRRNSWGNIWSYIAAAGPILGEGEVGGFVYPDGVREAWTYRDGQVFWNGNRREESNFDGAGGNIFGAVYTPKRVMPVAVLIGPVTQAAGELMMIAFQGRTNMRSFGEPTRGLPTLLIHTELSDGTTIFVSGAFSYDRNGAIYDGPITPDVPTETDWAQFGTEKDPTVQAAQAWLTSQSSCKP